MILLSVFRCLELWFWVQVTGSIEIAEFSSTSDDHEVLFEVKVEGEGAAQAALQQAVRKMREKIMAKLAQYVAEINNV